MLSLCQSIVGVGVALVLKAAVVCILVERWSRAEERARRLLRCTNCIVAAFLNVLAIFVLRAGDPGDMVLLSITRSHLLMRTASQSLMRNSLNFTRLPQTQNNGQGDTWCQILRASYN
jgi:hypothetical protein